MKLKIKGYTIDLKGYKVTDKNRSELYNKKVIVNNVSKRNFKKSK